MRAAHDPREAFARWGSVRDELFRHHPSSPIPESDRSFFSGIPTFAYDPAGRVLGRVEDASAQRLEIGASDGGVFPVSRIGLVVFELFGRPQTLDLFWMEGYAGGLFLSFRDATSGSETYGGGRYLLDTIKGADLGSDGGELILDFNFAYAPSCAHDPRWACPLPPPANTLPIPVRAGERLAG